jgi:hypothetical protein
VPANYCKAGTTRSRACDVTVVLSRGVYRQGGVTNVSRRVKWTYTVSMATSSHLLSLWNTLPFFVSVTCQLISTPSPRMRAWPTAKHRCEQILIMVGALGSSHCFESLDADSLEHEVVDNLKTIFCFRQQWFCLEVLFSTYVSIDSIPYCL